jgi:heme exporter protein A
MKVSLVCNELTKYFSHRLIFGNVSISLNEQNSIGIVGKNGSGKSTLIKVIAGIISQSKGEIKLSVDEKVVPKDLHFKHIGLLSPYLSLYDELTGYENLDFFIKIKSPDKSSSEKEEKINFLLERVGLFKRKKDLYKNYSSGMKQRLKLAFALLNDPALLLLDEPCANLDKEGIDVVYSFAEEQRKRGILIVATNEESDLKLCDTLISIEDYKKRQD